MKKIAFVSFEGDMMCFLHALLNVWDYHEKGYEVALVMEGASTARILDIEKSPHKDLWQKIVEARLIKAVCKACAAQMGSLEKAEADGLPISAALSGHAPLEPYTNEGYEIILF